jgi:hypothetical protein
MVEVNKTETNMTKRAVSWNSHVANTAKKKTAIPGKQLVRNVVEDDNCTKLT